MSNEKKDSKPHFRLEHWQRIVVYLMLYDMAAVTFSYFASLLLRFDFVFSHIPNHYLQPWLRFAPIYVLLCIIVFWLFRLYRSIWRFASYVELSRIIKATVVTSIIQITGMAVTMHIMSSRLADYMPTRMPLSYYIMGISLQFILITGIRFLYRFVLLLRVARSNRSTANIMLVGAGAAGQMLLRDINRSADAKEKIVCIIDDNPNKWGREIDGVRIAGGRGSIIECAREFDIERIYVALPSISAAERRKIIEICRDTGCSIKSLPSLIQLAHGDVTVSSLKPVDIEDLLGREPVELKTREIKRYLKEKTVLITGGGGSIGSELCRQVAAVPGIRKLIIFDIYENSAHEITLELKDKYPDLELETLIGSVRNSRRINSVFEKYKPDIVFHAAAHKHVPLMEYSPCEAIKNNVLGTYYTAYAAMMNDCEKFVLISTDKAVNPVNIMGASKRICEIVIQTFAAKVAAGKAADLPDLSNIGSKSEEERHILPNDIKTEFVAVRFGNVLGSNGSVIPRFREQIEKGGPVTVTHPDMVRYFMTIPEAARLVLTASTIGGGGRIYVLDMGTPVKIDDLARSMIELSGMKPDRDINIVYTGLRPGEKLYEERLMDEEGLEETENHLISIGAPIPIDEDEFLKSLKALIEAAYDESDDIRSIVEDMVDTYHAEAE